MLSKFRYIALFVIVAFIPQSRSFADPVLPPNLLLAFNSDPQPTSENTSIIIPFRRAGNLILIAAKADSIEGNFILDTGAPYLVLNITYFRSYHAKDSSVRGGITGDFMSAGQVALKDFSYGSVKYHNVQADLADLSHIEDSRKEKILGLLGVNLFKQFEMIIDYANSVIYLRLIKKKERGADTNEMLKDTGTYHIFPIEIKDNKIITKAAVGDKTLNFIIDTGAESNVLDSRLPGNVFDNVVINRRVTLVGSGSEKVEAVYGDLSNLKLKNIMIGKLPVLITNLEQMCLSYNYCIDGMLGFDFLSMHKIGFNFVKHEMYIWK